jgi:hypothetical protein
MNLFALVCFFLLFFAKIVNTDQRGNDYSEMSLAYRHLMRMPHMTSNMVFVQFREVADLQHGKQLEKWQTALLE